MKKRLAKILTVVASFALILPVFALAGCKDKDGKDNNSSDIDDNNDQSSERVLDSVEQSIVGEWVNQPYSTNSSTQAYKDFVFYPDGTCSIDGGARTKFYHDGDGQDDLFGHYNVIKLSYFEYRLYDFAKGVLYLSISRKPGLIKIGSHRILHNCEKAILGTWQDKTSKNKQYTFYSDGTVSCTSWQGTDERYFFIHHEDEHSKKGHYYVFKFFDDINTWEIYDNEPDIAYSQYGPIIATRV